RLRVGTADPLLAPAVIPLDLLCPLFAAFPGPALQLLQPFLLIGIQPLPIHARLFRHFHQLFRRLGGVGLHMGGIRDSQPSADQTGGDALPHYFLKQPPEYLPKAGFPPPQLTDRAVVRYQDRKSTRLNSSHVSISYAVFCLKKKNDRTHDLAPSD